MPFETKLPEVDHPSPSVRAYVREAFERVEAARKWAKEANIEAQKKMKQYHDNRVTTHDYQVGDKVWLYSVTKVPHKKLKHFYTGPFYLIEQT